MAKTKKIVKKPEQQPIVVKNKKLALATMIIGYIAFALIIVGGVLTYLGIYGKVKFTEAATKGIYAIVILSQVVALAFGALLLAKTRKHDSKGMKVADLVVGIILIVAMFMVICGGTIWAISDAKSGVLYYFIWSSLSISEAAAVTGCVFSTIDFRNTK